MQIKSTLRLQLTAAREVYTQKSANNCCRGCGGKNDTTVGGSGDWCSHSGSQHGEWSDNQERTLCMTQLSLCWEYVPMKSAYEKAACISLWLTAQIHNCKAMKTSQMRVNRWLEEETAEHLLCGIVPSH